VFLQKIEAKPAALLGESRTQQKSFLFPLEEKIRRAQNQKCRENFFAGWRVVASGGGLASLVWFRSRISDKMSSSQTVKTHQNSNEARPRRSEVRDHSRVHMSVGVKLEHLLYTQKVAGFQPLHRPP